MKGYGTLNDWNIVKNRLGKEGSESVTKCNRLTLPAPDAKNYLTDVAAAEALLRPTAFSSALSSPVIPSALCGVGVQFMGGYG